MNGNVPSKQANTYSTIDELKEYFAEPRAGGDEKARLKIVDALQVKGAAAWIVHNAAKRNYDKHRKGIGSSSLTASPRALTYDTESHAALECAPAGSSQLRLRQGCWPPYRRGQSTYGDVGPCKRYLS